MFCRTTHTDGRGFEFKPSKRNSYPLYRKRKGSSSPLKIYYFKVTTIPCTRNNPPHYSLTIQGFLNGKVTDNTTEYRWSTTNSWESVPGLTFVRLPRTLRTCLNSLCDPLLKNNENSKSNLSRPRTHLITVGGLVYRRLYTC